MTSMPGRDQMRRDGRRDQTKIRAPASLRLSSPRQNQFFEVSERASEDDLGALQASTSSEFDGPGFEARPFRGSRQHDMGGFEQSDPHGTVRNLVCGAGLTITL
jgi:hypothetical protein